MEFPSSLNYPIIPELGRSIPRNHLVMKTKKNLQPTHPLTFSQSTLMRSLWLIPNFKGFLQIILLVTRIFVHPQNVDYLKQWKSMANSFYHLPTLKTKPFPNSNTQKTEREEDTAIAQMHTQEIIYISSSNPKPKQQTNPPHKTIVAAKKREPFARRLRQLSRPATLGFSREPCAADVTTQVKKSLLVNVD